MATKWRPSHCHQCGRPDSVAGRMSKRGLCCDCGLENQRANAQQLAEKSGPAYLYYAKRQTAGHAAWVAKVQAQIDAAARRAG